MNSSSFFSSLRRKQAATLWPKTRSFYCLKVSLTPKLPPDSLSRKFLSQHLLPALSQPCSSCTILLTMPQTPSAGAPPLPLHHWLQGGCQIIQMEALGTSQILNKCLVILTTRELNQISGFSILAYLKTTWKAYHNASWGYTSAFQMQQV